MATSLHDYSTPIVANMPVGPAINTGNGNFELHTGLLTMVQANQFCGLPSEDANVHLQNFLELCESIIIKDVALESVKLCLFPFSLLGMVKHGSTRARKLSTRGTNVQPRSSQNFSP